MKTQSRLAVRRAVLAALAVSMFAALAAPAAAEDPAPPPSLRLKAAETEITVVHSRYSRVALDPGVFVVPVGGTFALHVLRPAYAAEPMVQQVWTDSTGEHERILPNDVLDGWRGLEDFLHVVVKDSHFKVVRDVTRTFCPDVQNPQRLKPTSPADPTMPAMCGPTYNPFPIGGLWGIDRGWAVDPLSAPQYDQPFGYLAPKPIWFNAPDGRYRVTVSIDPRYVDLLGIDPSKASRTVVLTMETGDPGCPPNCFLPDDPSRPQGAWPRLPEVKDGPPPDTQYLPDLASRPAFWISTYHRRGQDYMSFAATEWAGGGSDLDVEGFRRPDSDVMDAYQYFFVDGEVVGRAPVGTMEFDDDPGHHHWHFLQFARYRLLDSTRAVAVRSHKQSFCIGPSDPVDLTLPGATTRASLIGFFNACGTPTVLWVRERLPLGWGDTYLQSVAGQAFDITTVPNGSYFIEVEVNPAHLLYEQDTANNSSFRRVILRGDAGHRRVCVPPLGGVDREGFCPNAGR